ncbi:MAG: NfeD family protein [Gaiella sp.]
MLTIIAIVLAVLVLPSPWGLVAVVVAALIDLVEALFFLWWTKRREPTVGVEDLVGRRGVVVTPLAPEGQVRIFGELWRARGAPAAPIGSYVVVIAVDGLLLEVASADEVEARSELLGP